MKKAGASLHEPRHETRRAERSRRTHSLRPAHSRLAQLRYGRRAPRAKGFTRHGWCSSRPLAGMWAWRPGMGWRCGGLGAGGSLHAGIRAHPCMALLSHSRWCGESAGAGALPPRGVHSGRLMQSGVLSLGSQTSHGHAHGLHSRGERQSGVESARVELPARGAACRVEMKP